MLPFLTHLFRNTLLQHFYDKFDHNDDVHCHETQYGQHYHKDKNSWQQWAQRREDQHTKTTTTTTTTKIKEHGHQQIQYAHDDSYFFPMTHPFSNVLKETASGVSRRWTMPSTTS